MEGMLKTRSYAPGALNPWLAGNLLPAETFVMRKLFLTFYRAKPRCNAKEFGKNYELFIYGDIHLITNSLYKTVLRKPHPGPVCLTCLSNFPVIPDIIIIIIITRGLLKHR